MPAMLVYTWNSRNRVVEAKGSLWVTGDNL